MKIPDHVITEILNKADIVEIAGNYLQLKKKGNRYWGLCPFHSEKTPSFTVTPEKNIYYCFGCHKGGSIFNFLMEMEKISYPEAVKMAGKMAGVEVNFSENKEQTSFRESMLELYEKVAGCFHYILLNNSNAESARQYLLNRGVSNEMIIQFKIGYAPPDKNWLYTFLTKKNYSPDFLAKSGLFQSRYNENVSLFRGRIIFPISNLRGEVIAFGGRTISDSMPKYLNSPETYIFKKSDNLYGIAQALDFIRKSSHFYLVEGYLDVIAMHQGGIKNCVAPLGTALTERQIKLLKRYVEKGCLLFDGDEAGIKATLKAVELMENEDLTSSVVELPEEKDPADILQKDGINTLNNLLKCSINSFDYLIKKALLKFDYKTPTGKEKIFDYLFSYIEKVNSEIKRDGFLNALAEVLDVNPSSVHHDFLNRNRKQEYKSRDIENTKITINDELFLMLAVAVNRDYFIRLRKYIPLDLVENASAKEIYIALEECFREDKKSLESLLEKVDNGILKTIIVEKNSSGEFTLNVEKMIDDSIYRLKKRYLSKRRAEISSLLKKIEKNEPWKMKDLLVEKMVLDKEYEELKVISNA